MGTNSYRDSCEHSLGQPRGSVGSTRRATFLDPAAVQLLGTSRTCSALCWRLRGRGVIYMPMIPAPSLKPSPLALPKTRSGKIHRKTMRQTADGEE